ncbi:DNA gyrase subunit B [Actinoplanes sp. N902-109]|nr:DNA gyrase subunit B [Actinoplanes sp. N902-109]
MAGRPADGRRAGRATDERAAGRRRTTGGAERAGRRGRPADRDRLEKSRSVTTTAGAGFTDIDAVPRKDFPGLLRFYSVGASYRGSGTLVRAPQIAVGRSRVVPTGPPTRIAAPPQRRTIGRVAARARLTHADATRCDTARRQPDLPDTASRTRTQVS